jgi:hypothetical protein
MLDILDKLTNLFRSPMKRYTIEHSSLDRIGTVCTIGESAYSVYLSSKIDERIVLDTFIGHVERALSESAPDFDSVVKGSGRCPLQLPELMEQKPCTYWAAFEVSAAKSGSAGYVLFYTDTAAFFRKTMLDAAEAAQKELDAAIRTLE